jgi:hypothetical protein
MRNQRNPHRLLHHPRIVAEGDYHSPLPAARRLPKKRLFNRDGNVLLQDSALPLYTQNT